jgi:hypothetical protein
LVPPRIVAAGGGNLPGARRALRDGQIVEVDGDAGPVVVRPDPPG